MSHLLERFVKKSESHLSVDVIQNVPGMNRIMVKKSIEARSVHVVAGHKSQFDSGIQFQRHFVLIERLLYTHYIISLISLEFYNKSVPIITLLFFQLSELA